MILTISEVEYYYQLKDLELEQEFFEENYIIKYNELYCTESEKTDKIKKSLKDIAIKLKNYIIEKIDSIIRYIKELSLIVTKNVNNQNLKVKIKSLKDNINLPFVDFEYLDSITDFIVNSGNLLSFTKSQKYSNLLKISRLLYQYGTLHTKDDMIKNCVKLDNDINEIRQELEDEGLAIFGIENFAGFTFSKKYDYSNYDSLKKELNDKLKPERKSETIICDKDLKKKLELNVDSITHKLLKTTFELNNITSEHNKQARLCDKIISKIEDDTYREYYFTVQKYAMVVLKFFSMHRQYCTLCIEVANRGYNYLSSYINVAYNTSKAAKNNVE